MEKLAQQTANELRESLVEARVVSRFVGPPSAAI